MQSEPETSTPRPWVKSIIHWFMRVELGPLLALIILIIGFTIADEFWGGGRFASVRNLRVVLNTTSLVAVTSLGMTIIIIAGGIDLSAGTALTLCATVLAFCLRHDVNAMLAVAATLVAGCACGFANGALISALRVVPFIVTLGTMTIYIGIGTIIAEGKSIFPDRNTQVPKWLHSLCSTSGDDMLTQYIPRLPPGVLFAAVLGTAVAVMLRYTIFGRYVFALGSNESTARLCGINVPWTKVAVYTIAGLFVAIGGIYHFANLKVGNPREGLGLELQVIAAVVIGGGSLSGGRGSVLGSFTGAAIMSVIHSGCDQLGVHNQSQEIIIGLIIIAAVAIDQLRQRSS